MKPRKLRSLGDSLPRLRTKFEIRLNYINLTLDHLRSAFAPTDPDKRETFERLAFQLKAEVARINTHITDFLSYSRPAAAGTATTESADRSRKRHATSRSSGRGQRILKPASKSRERFRM